MGLLTVVIPIFLMSAHRIIVSSLVIPRLPLFSVGYQSDRCQSGSGFERPSTPTSEDDSPPPNEPPEFVSRPQDTSDEDEALPNRKKGGYDSRVEKILYENPDLQIIITDAGKSHQSGGSYIVYTIRTGVCISTGTSVGAQADLM